MSSEIKSFSGFAAYETGKIITGRLPRGQDLLKSMTKLVKEAEINSGYIQVLGAVRNARLGYFNQKTTEYEYIDFNYPLEIIHCGGNISKLEDEPMIHAHIALGDDQGNSYGGHLAEGTEIYVAEVILQEFKGEPLERVTDPESGLSLWRTD